MRIRFVFPGHRPLIILDLILAGLACSIAACTTIPTPPAIATRTAIPVPTLARTAVNTLSPAPAPTLAPTQALPLVPTRVPSATAATACDNPFYPAGLHNRWEYRVKTDSASPVSSYSKTITKKSAGGFTERYTFDNTDLDSDWTCSTDGLTANQFANLSLQRQNQFQLDTLRHVGISLPGPTQWILGKSWTNSYDLQGRFKTGALDISGTGKADVQNTIATRESITTPAGTYDSFRADSVITIQFTSAGLSTPGTVTLRQSSWYSRGVGLVKSNLVLGSQTATTELARFTP